MTGHSYIVYGPLSNGTTSVMWEGAPDYPNRGIWWELVERYGVSILYCAPTAIRACIKWGAEWPNKRNLDSLRLLGSVGEPINPKAWLCTQGHRAPAMPDRRHVVADGDRCDHDHPAPGHHHDEARFGDNALPGRLRGRIDESTGESVAEGQGLLVLTLPWPSMLRTLYKEDDRFIETYFSRFGREVYLVGDAARRDKDGYLG